MSVALTTAPGSTVLSTVETLQLTLTDPHQVTTAMRVADSFTIELDLPASDGNGALLVDGLDASGTLVATGASPAFPLNAINANITIYMAAPNTMGASPVGLTTARDQLASGVLSYGAIFAGGRDASGAPSDALEIYNAFDHSLTAGLAMPAPLAAVALGVGESTDIYLFGGLDATGATTGDAQRFDTSVAPTGQYSDYGVKTGFERANQLAVTLGNEEFVITGSPVAILSGLDGSMVAQTAVAALPPAGATVTASDGVTTSIFAGADGVERFRGGVFDALNAPAAARADASVVALPAGQVAVVCGGPDAILIDAATAAAQTFPAVPSALRTGCAVGATSRYMLVAGGTLADGTIATDAEIYDATTLALVATAPLVVPRTGATALPLPNGQILLVGGDDATGAPTATIELFTPTYEDVASP